MFTGTDANKEVLKLIAQEDRGVEVVRSTNRRGYVFFPSQNKTTDHNYNNDLDDQEDQEDQY